jgi:outer membrane lipoprotein-sorting protein
VDTGSNGKTSLKKPYRLSFNTIAARMILPANGDSTWAFNNQVFKKITGVLIAKAVP